MSAAVTTATSPVPAAGDPSLNVDATLFEALTAEFTGLVGWNWAARRISFPREHPLLGWNACTVASCGIPMTSSGAMCHACAERWRRSGRPDLDDFAVTTPRKRRGLRPGSCSVGGCGRPQDWNGTFLCSAHYHQCRSLELTVEQFLADGRVLPHSWLGVCAVAACDWDRYGRGPYCHSHTRRLTDARIGSTDFDEERWRRTAAPLPEDAQVCLLGLPDQVALEVVYGLQARTEDGSRTDFSTLRLMADRARLSEVNTLRDLPDAALSQNWTRPMRNSIVEALDRRDNDPVTNFSSDVWKLGTVGHRGTLRFAAIEQTWLREATKRWVFDQLPSRRGARTDNIMKGYIGDLARFSASLTRHRKDDGNDPRALSRHDVLQFLSWLAHLETIGEISAQTRHRVCSNVSTVLRRMRSIGLNRPGRPLEGLPNEVTIERGDLPDAHRDDAGRDLPPAVVSALIAALPELEAQAGREIRVAVELLMDTGRRPTEITSLPLDCLGRDSDETPVLIWDNLKAGRYGRRLPISEATAGVIVAQQDRVRARYPHVPDADLALLPRTLVNRDGRHPVTHQWLGAKHRHWIDSLPALYAPTTVEVDGLTVTQDVPFTRSSIQPYCWRHTYAQRHADAGVEVDVLRDLLDHTQMSTTQRYYRVSKARQRRAVDRVTSMQFDRHGDRLWRQTEVLLDSERARRAIGQVAVPYGICTEPTNVAAGGSDCPVRFRCVGCNHFRTDVSYLPDLEAYLADLLRNRERLLATSADTWAITEAMPSEQEISRMRTLISRVKADLDELDESDRAEIREAVTAVRRTRSGAVSLGLPRIRPQVPDIREEHSP